MEWNNMSNSDIRIKMKTMEEEYENVKNKINVLINKLDALDIEYDKAKRELENRIKK